MDDFCYKEKCQMKIIKTNLIIVGVLLMLTGCTKENMPNEEQIKTDWMQEICNDDTISVSEFSLESQQEGEKLYKAIIVVVYDDTKIEYQEKYRFTYEKYDTWILDDIEAYEKDAWTIRPLVAPSVEEYLDECETMLYEEENLEYDCFEPLAEKTTENLSKGEVCFTFAVKNERVIETVLGEIEFLIMFDEEYGEWRIDSYLYCDSLEREYDLLHTWSGKGSHLGEQGTEIIEEHFSIQINNCENGKVDAVLMYNDQEYKVSGEIVLPESIGNDLNIDLCDEEEKIHVEGFINCDGEMSVIIDTAYNPESMYYKPVDRYSVDLFLE